MPKIILAHELLEEGIRKSHIAKHLNVSCRTIIRWSKAKEEHGSLDVFLTHYDQAKKGSRKKRKRDTFLKRRVFAVREKHHQCCGQKTQYFLEKDGERNHNIQSAFREISIMLKMAEKHTTRGCA